MNLFRRRKSRSNSIPDSLEAPGPHVPGRRLSLPSSSESESDDASVAISQDEYDLSRTASHPLSEAETLNNDRRARLDLQATFNDNFDNYLPFVLRRLRLAALNERELAPDEQEDEMEDDDGDDDDDITMLNESIDQSAARRPLIMNRRSSDYNYKRSMVLATEFLKSSVYIFPDAESFRVFKELRAGIKKARKVSVTVYENGGGAKTVKSSQVSSTDTIDTRPHIIPIENKNEGVGLPLFKVSVPYMASFRKNSPFLMFNRYIEVPTKPTGTEADLDPTTFETYTYCTIHTKKFSEVRRYIMTFTPAGGEPFKLLMFQHNFKPFTDFRYKGTRFRVLGTAVNTAYGLTYNPTLRLLIIDEKQPSLCDEIVNRKPGFEISLLLKRRKSSLGNEKSDSAEDVSSCEPEDFPNPHPSSSNPLLNYVYYQFDNGSNYSNIKDHIPNELPPFGGFKDSLLYDGGSGIIPKKYNEVGKIELYQDIVPETPESTRSVDQDNLVLTCILTTLRENNLKNTGRPSNTSFALANRFSGTTSVQRAHNPATDIFMPHPSSSLPL